MIKKYKEEIRKSIEDLKHKDTFYKQIPNILTFIRLIGGIPAGLMYYFGNPTAALILIAALWGTDAIDGRIARKYKIQSKLGADMDALADKIMFLGSAIPLLSTVPSLALNFVLEGVISAINLTGRAKGLDTKTVKSGKIKTILLALTLISGYLVQFLHVPTLTLIILKGITTGYQLIAINDYITEFNKMNKEKKAQNSKNIEEETKDHVLEEENEKDKTLTPEHTKRTVEELQRERDFLLSFNEPDKTKEGKKRKREKNNK